MKDVLREMLFDCIDEVTFPDYTFEYADGENSGARLRAYYMDTDVETGVLERQNTRWWVISQHAVKSEIVQTMFKCIITSKEHFTREHFLYRGRPVFGPHFDIDALYEICERTDKRPGPEVADKRT